MMRLRPLPVRLYAPGKGGVPEGNPEPGREELKEELREQERMFEEPPAEEILPEATDIETAKALHLFNDQVDFAVEDDLIIGSNPGLSDVVIEEEGTRYISGRHCRIRKEPGGYYISDMGSANGTIINGKKIRVGAKAALMDGDRIRLGKTVLMVEEA